MNRTRLTFSFFVNRATLSGPISTRRCKTVSATVLDVKHSEVPPRTLKHPCSYHLMRHPGFPTLCPSLAIRAQRPTQLFGLVQNRDVTTLAVPRSLKTSATSVYHVRVASRHIIHERRTKIQGF